MGDVDLALRHLATRHPDDLARVFVPGPRSAEAPRWLDSQFAARERRIDKGLLVHRLHDRVALHTEWCWEPDADFGFRAMEYQYQIMAAVRDDDAARAKAALPKRLPPPLPVRVLTVAVVLNGPAGDRSETGTLSITPDGAPVHGNVAWVVDRVYQRPAEELLARPGVLWPVFVPFAADASEGAVTRAVQALRGRAHSAEEFADAAAALAVLAQGSPRSQGLREVVMALVEPNVIENNWIFQRGMDKGRAEGLRTAIAALFAARGLRLTAARRAQLDAETDLEVLQTWHTRAITAERAADVFAETR